MKKPDRFVRVVKKEFDLKSGTFLFYPREIVTQLLRAEHRAVVRLVKGQKWCNPTGDIQKGHNAALDDILEALARRGA